MAKGLAVGLNKGHIVSKIEVPSKSAKGTNPRKRVTLIRRVVSEITGKSAYERRIIEMMKQSKANAGKRAYKLAKRYLGTHKRAQKKKAELADFISKGK